MYELCPLAPPPLPASASALDPGRRKAPSSTPHDVQAPGKLRCRHLSAASLPFHSISWSHGDSINMCAEESVTRELNNDRRRLDLSRGRAKGRSREPISRIARQFPLSFPPGPTSPSDHWQRVTQTARSETSLSSGPQCLGGLEEG